MYLVVKYHPVSNPQLVTQWNQALRVDYHRTLRELVAIINPGVQSL